MTQKSQNKSNRPRRNYGPTSYGGGFGGFPPSGVGLKTDWGLGENKPLEELLAEQRAADERMAKFVQGARQHD